jgi:hypothetical protein
MKMEQAERSETSAYKIHTPGITQTKVYNLSAYEDGTDSVSKRRQIKFMRRGITQKKVYNLSAYEDERDRVFRNVGI